MDSGKPDSRLAAILAAEVGNFSRLVDLDEHGTGERLSTQRRDVIDPVVAEHGGRVFQDATSRFLAEFASLLDAVKCATAILQAAGQQKGVAADRQLRWRIGVNLGDVYADRGTLIGDGIVVAIGLRGMADPGTILVPDEVYRQVNRKVEARFHELGVRRFDTQDEPLRVYRLGPGAPGSRPPSSTGAHHSVPGSSPTRIGTAGRAIRSESTGSGLRSGMRSGSARRSSGTSGDRDRTEGALEAGTVLNNSYRVEDLIAHGGMGDVYRATNLATGEECAIKTIRDEYVDEPRLVQLFRREATALRRVSHPAVIRYEGAFTDADGGLYLAMEYVDGPSLTEAIRAGGLRPKLLIDLRDRLAAGLAAAHAQGVVHRDLSTDNIILPQGRFDQAKIIDFGIARQVDPLRSPDGTQPKTVIGTQFAGNLQFASPEQLLAQPADARSDIYSLGLVLAAAAQGHSLDMGSTLARAIEARRTVPDLSRLPAEVRRWLTPMLQPDPAKRPASAAELIRGQGKSISARHWLVGAGVAASLAIVSIGGWLASDLLTRPSPAQELAVWEAVDKGSPAALRQFAERNPAHARAADARQLADQIERDASWNAVNKADVAALRQFADQNATHPRAVEARMLADQLDSERRRAGERIAWETVNRTDIVSLRTYLQRYPDSPHAPEARALVDKLETDRKLAADQQALWERVNKQDPRALRQFATANRSHPRAEEAVRLADQMEAVQRRTAERAAWEVTNRNDPAALASFLQRFPDGAYAAEAQQALKQLDSVRQRGNELQATWDSVNKQDPQELRRFAVANPNHPRAEEARRLAAQIEESRDVVARSAWEFVNQQDVNALRTFAQKYPNSTYAAEATKIIERIEREKREPDPQAVWDSINKQDAAAVGRFAEAYPNHPRAADARRLQERLQEERNKARERSAWESINRSDPVALREFAERFPNSTYAAEARRVLERMENDRRLESAWDGVNKQDAGALRRFIETYPQHPRAMEARRLLEQAESQGSWAAVKKDDPVALRKFADANPKHAQAGEAKRLADQVEKAAWDGVNKNDQTALRSYATANQASPFAATARQRADKLDLEAREWPQAANGNAAAVRQFLQRYPDGRYANDARNRFATLEQQAWTNLQAKEVDEASLQSFLAEFPGGRYSREAQRLLQELRRPETQKAEPPQAKPGDPNRAWDPSAAVPAQVLNLGVVSEASMQRQQGAKPAPNPTGPLFGVQIQGAIRDVNGYSEFPVSVVNNHHERILDPIVDCEFLNNDRRVAVRRVNPRGMQPGETVRATVQGPPISIYVNGVRCIPVGPFK